MRREQSKKYNELKAEAIRLYQEADRVSCEADYYYDEEIYWEDALAKNPEYIRRISKKNGRSRLTKTSRYESNREYYDKEYEVIGYGRKD